MGDNEEEDKRVDVMRGDKGTEPLHAGPRCPVDEVLLDLQQSVERELQQLVGEQGRISQGFQMQKKSLNY